MGKLLIVLLGPTGVGKTDLSISLARWLNSPIISCDSRQFYRQLRIGVAAPTQEQLERVQHYFVGMLDIEDAYNAARFEEDALRLIAELHAKQSVSMMAGGAMMYIDAVCKGIDQLPDISPELHAELCAVFETEGLAPLCRQLKLLDPQHYFQVDLKNPKRVIHALEICLTAGKPYSSLRTNPQKARPFEIVKIGLRRSREELYARINARVDEMMNAGLLDEVESLLPFRSYNALNTVGYKELFTYFEGQCSLDEAVEKIKQHTRIYSRKQMSWFNKDPSISWFHPDESEKIFEFLKKCMSIER
ncbi:MAG: tRNA (adenosine(37)-N6)-dimethylallyltransferase MiaA [Bacteroidales bacterium]|jgi:tRNA dimethylallyltransferase|nr:tRNA (adenosine(37)-N6)-dimethylallyltransferase MiaA [Bacteroidales bacterium]